MCERNFRHNEPGGVNGGEGTVFSITAGGEEKVLHGFNSSRFGGDAPEGRRDGAAASTMLNKAATRIVASVTG